MKLNVTFPELERQREKFGARPSSWKGEAYPLSERGKILREIGRGIDIGNIQDVKIGPGFLLSYEGEQIILYIKDTRDSRWTLENMPEESKRFHITDCYTLQEMRRENRFERYVITNRKDGRFLVEAINLNTQEPEEMEASLKVCKNCLSRVNWHGYQDTHNRAEMNRIWKNFSISEFFMEYSTFFPWKPSRRDTTSELHRYASNWHRISERMRQRAEWYCEQCKVCLSTPRNYRYLLHCHHINGVVTDNQPSNLKVLCALCHASQPKHQHMKISDKEQQIIMEARRKQRL